MNLPPILPVNWFVNWDDASCSEHGKCFFLQIRLEDVNINLVHSPCGPFSSFSTPSTSTPRSQSLFRRSLPSFLRDRMRNNLPNLYTTIYRRHHDGTAFARIGTTDVVTADASPNYADGVRIFYDQHTNLNNDIIKIVCLQSYQGHGRGNINRGQHKQHDLENVQEHFKGSPSDVEVGSCSLSINELVRAFGARVQMELVNEQTNAVVGHAWFLAEAMPIGSPRRNECTSRFHLSLDISNWNRHRKHLHELYNTNRKSSSKWTKKSKQETTHMRLHMHTHSNEFFVCVERQREDQTWSVVHRGRPTNITGSFFSRITGRNHSPLLVQRCGTAGKRNKKQFNRRETVFDDDNDRQKITNSLTTKIPIKQKKIYFPPFTLRRGELLLGEGESRKIRFSFFVVDRWAGHHLCIGTVTTSFSYLRHGYRASGAILDMKNEQGNLIGNFKLIKRYPLALEIEEEKNPDCTKAPRSSVDERAEITCFDIHVRFLETGEIQKIRTADNDAYDSPRLPASARPPTPMSRDRDQPGLLGNTSSDLEFQPSSVLTVERQTTASSTTADCSTPDQHQMNDADEAVIFRHDLGLHQTKNDEGLHVDSGSPHLLDNKHNLMQNKSTSWSATVMDGAEINEEGAAFSKAERILQTSERSSSQFLEKETTVYDEDVKVEEDDSEMRFHTPSTESLLNEVNAGDSFSLSQICVPVATMVALPLLDDNSLGDSNGHFPEGLKKEFTQAILS